MDCAHKDSSWASFAPPLHQDASESGDAIASASSVKNQALPELRPRDQTPTQHLVEGSERREIIVDRPADIENCARRPRHRYPSPYTAVEQMRVEGFMHPCSHDRVPTVTRARDGDAAGWAESVEAVDVRRRKV
jgi:hypothetical protein